MLLCALGPCSACNASLQASRTTAFCFFFPFKGEELMSAEVCTSQTRMDRTESSQSAISSASDSVASSVNSFSSSEPLVLSSSLASSVKFRKWPTCLGRWRIRSFGLAISSAARPTYETILRLARFLLFGIWGSWRLLPSSHGDDGPGAEVFDFPSPSTLLAASMFASVADLLDGLSRICAEEANSCRLLADACMAASMSLKRGSDLSRTAVLRAVVDKGERNTRDSARKRLRLRNLASAVGKDVSGSLAGESFLAI